MSWQLPDLLTRKAPFLITGLIYTTASKTCPHSVCQNINAALSSLQSCFSYSMSPPSTSDQSGKPLRSSTAPSMSIHLVSTLTRPARSFIIRYTYVFPDYLFLLYILSSSCTELLTVPQILCVLSHCQSLGSNCFFYVEFLNPSSIRLIPFNPKT